MRAVNLFGMLIMCVGLVVIGPTISTGQPGGKKGGNPFGGGGGTDPNAIFDYYAQGRNYFLISQSRTQGAQLTQFAQEKGITNGQITRQQYLEFTDWRTKQALANGGMNFGKAGGITFGKKGFGMDLQPQGGVQGGPPSAEAISQAAKLEFDSLDRNKDGVLNQEEMPGFLRKDLAKWDKNSDGVIDFNEYKDYYTAKITARLQGDDSGRNGPAAIIIDDDELDRKPIVFRAGGKMPAGLPSWFKELDTDNDGQVALYEWRKAGKSMDEFANWDLNGDGFITPDEALKQQLALGKSGKGSPGTSLAPGEDGDVTSGGKNGKFGFPKGKGPGGGNPWGGGRPPSMGDGANPDAGSASDDALRKGNKKKGGGGGN